MSDDLGTLATQRSKLLEEFLGPSDLRPGSITAVTQRCGKPSCHCAKRNDPGHDPQFRLTRRVAGKTVTETFPNATPLRKAQQEVAEFHRFQKLSQNLHDQRMDLSTPSRRAGARRLDGPEKKTAAAIHEEVAREVNRFLGRVFAGRSSKPRRGSTSVAMWQRLSRAIRENPLQTVLTIVGSIRPSRPYYLCSRCHVGQFPLEVELDIKNREFPPGVCRMHARVGQQASFNHGREQLKVLAGLQGTTKSVERIVEAIGAHIAQCEQKEQSGMFLDHAGAKAILALRCSHLNGGLEDNWEERREGRAA